MTAVDQSLVVICRACLSECKEYKALHKEGIILGEITTLASLLHFCTDLEFSEHENAGLPDFICSTCIQELARSFLFKKKVLESNEVLRSQVVEDEEEEPPKDTAENDKENEHYIDDGDAVQHDSNETEKEDSRSCESEADLKELAEAAQMKRELEAQIYETTDEYAVIQNDDEGQQTQDEHDQMEEDDDMEYVVQEVAETTEIYHTTEIEDEHSNSHHHNHSHNTGHDIDVDDETDVQQVGEDEEEVEFEIHVNDIEDEYHEIITDDPVGVETQERVKRHYESKNINSESSDNGQASISIVRGKRNRNKSANKTPNPDYQCKVCSKQLSNSSSYKYHMQLHSDDRPYKCEVCDDRFKTRNAYEGHRVTHNPENPNTCEICGKSYRQAPSLRIHMFSHTGEKPFKCEICGKCLTQKSGYKKHMLTHTGEKPYPCDLCGKAFRISSNMLAHRRSHLGEKPYVCLECGNSFGTSEQLKRHMMVHSDDTPFSCDICGKQFKRQSTLRAHLQSHENHVTVTHKKVGKSSVVEII